MPTDKYYEYPITWEKGLIQSVEDSMLPAGSAAYLRNWQADTSGNLRARVPWLKGSTTGAPSSRRGRGIGHVARPRQAIIRQDAVASNNTVSDTGRTITATWPATTVAGNTLVYMITVSDGAAGISITTPAGFTAGPTVSLDAGNGRAALFYKQNIAGGDTTAAVTYTNTNSNEAAVLHVIELMNVISSSFDLSDSNTDTSTPYDLGPFASDTAQANEIILGWWINTGSAVPTSPTFTNGFSFMRTQATTGAVTAAQLGAAKVTTAIVDDAAGALTQMSGTGGAVDAEIAISFKSVASGATDGIYLVAVDDNTDSYDVYAVDRSNLGAGTFVLLDSVAAATRTSPVAFTSGLGAVYWTNEQFTRVRQQDVNGTVKDVPTVAPGRCIAFHKNRLFIGGALETPSRLSFSEVGDSTIWSGGTAGYIDVSLNDGETIEDILPFEDGLLISKQTSLWFLSGSGPSTHRLVQITDGGGTAPGRTLLATPFGAIVAGRSEIRLYAGGQAQLISRPIRDSYGITGNFMTCSVRDEAGYICDEGSGTIWVIDFASGGTWREEVMGSASTEGPSIIFNQDKTQLMAPRNATVGSALNYRNIPGTERNKDFDTLSETFSAWTPEIWLAGPSKRFTPAYLFMKIRQRFADPGSAGLVVTPVYDGTSADPITIDPRPSAGVYWVRKALGAGGIAHIQLQLEQALLSTQNALMEPEEMRIGYRLDEKR